MITFTSGWIESLMQVNFRHKKADLNRSAFLNLVRKERLELSRREALEPKSSVSTNSTTPASDDAYYRDTLTLVNRLSKIFSLNLLTETLYETSVYFMQ